MKIRILSYLLVGMATFSIASQARNSSVIDEAEGREEKKSRGFQVCDRTAGECMRLAREYRMRVEVYSPSPECKDSNLPVLCIFK